eukprot:1488783-Rhodomonas_salina.6
MRVGTAPYAILVSDIAYGRRRETAPYAIVVPDIVYGRRRETTQHAILVPDIAYGLRREIGEADLASSPRASNCRAPYAMSVPDFA